MKKSLIFFALSGLLILGITSCSTTKVLPTNVSNNALEMANAGNKAMVYLYRISSMGFAVGLDVDCNNKELAKLFPKQFFLDVLDPGKYVFTGRGENEDDLVLTLEPNKKYYIEVSPKMGWVKARCKLELMELSEGNKKVQKCKLVGMNQAAKELLNYKE